MSSPLQNSCLFILRRELSPVLVKGQPLWGLSGSLDLSLTFQINCEDHPRIVVVRQSAPLPGGGGATEHPVAVGRQQLPSWGSPLPPDPGGHPHVPIASAVLRHGPQLFCSIPETAATSFVDTSLVCFLFYHLRAS